MVKARKFADISKMTEDLRKEKLGHMSTEIEGKGDPPTELPKKEEEDKAKIKPISQEQEPKERSKTPVEKEQIKKPEKNEKEVRPKEEEIYSDTIRISPLWNQVLQILYKTEKNKYKCREDLLQDILERTLMDDPRAKRVIDFVSTLKAEK